MVRAFKENPAVQRVFSGLRPAAAGLLAAAAFGAIRLSLWAGAAGPWTGWFRWIGGALFALLFAGIRVFKWHPALYIIIAAACGVALKL